MKPVKYVKRFDSKTQNAHLILFDNGKEYVVKLHKKGAEKTLVNEWLGYHLARYMGLPIPITTLVELPEKFIKTTPELYENVILTKKQLATEYIKNSKDAHELEVLKVENKQQQLAGIIVLDYWLANMDRTRKNVLFTETRKKNKQYLWAIDYGDSFGSFAWKRNDLANLPESIMKSATHQLLSSFIKKEKEFNKQLRIINAIPILLLEEILSLIPSDWDIPEEEKEIIIRTLIKRRDEVVPDVIHQFIKKVYRPLQ